MKNEENEKEALNKTDVSSSYVYAFMYCPCIHESSHGTISLHKTEKGAEIAMEFHKENERIIHEDMYKNLNIDKNSSMYHEFGINENWCVVKLQVLE
jgi:hypothetical protein